MAGLRLKRRLDISPKPTASSAPSTPSAPSAQSAAPPAPLVSVAPERKRFGSLKRASRWILKCRAPLFRSDSSRIGHITDHDERNQNPRPTAGPDRRRELTRSNMPGNRMQCPVAEPALAAAPDQTSAPAAEPAGHDTTPSAVSDHLSQTEPETRMPDGMTFASQTIREALLDVPPGRAFARESTDFCQSFTFWRYARLLGAVEPTISNRDEVHECLDSELAMGRHSPPDGMDEHCPLDGMECACADPTTTSPEVDDASQEWSLPSSSGLSDLDKDGVDDDDEMSSYIDDSPFSSPDSKRRLSSNPFDRLAEYGLYIPMGSEGRSHRTSLPLPLETIISTTCWDVSLKYKRYGVLLDGGLQALVVP